MKTNAFLPAVCVTVACIASLHAFQTTPITAAAGPPALIETGGAGTFIALTEAEYQKLAAQMTQMPAFVGMKKKPDGLSAGARYGVNFTFGGKNRTWALDGDDTNGYTLYADINANGDLSDDPPMKMTRVEGRYSTYFETAVTAGDQSYPVRMKLVVDRVVPSGKTEKELALLTYGSTRRTGEITVGGKPIKFSLGGSQGIYSQPYQGIEIDINGDGALDPQAEGYLNSEKFINIGDVTYEFSVDRYGRSLTLTPQAEKKPGRVVLLPGYPAPDFAFADLAGTKRKVSDFKGKVLLIDFWGTWCGPCVASVPKMLEAYDKYHARGFEILGVDASDKRAKLDAFLAERKITWMQTMEEDDGPIATLYRVTGWPSYFLIGKDGRIVAAAPNGGELDLNAELAKLLPAK